MPDDPPAVSTVDLRDTDAAAALDRAFRNVGFVQLHGHAVGDEVAAGLWAAMDQYFALPAGAKRRQMVGDPVTNRGYRPRGSESLSYSIGTASPPDLFESFNIGHDDRVDGHRLLAPTPWPEHPAGFAAAARAYLDAMAALAARLDALIGPLLGLDDLAERSRGGPDTMACIRYERRADEAEGLAGQRRMGPHSDYTSFTMLRADAVPGLEILGPHGWISVVPEPGALVLNVGDLLAMWTDDAWPSTLHRVPILGGGLDPAVRRSVAYFHYPDLPTVVSPRPGWRRDDSTYREVTVAAHLTAKLVGPKRGEASTGTSTLAARRAVD